MPFNIASAALMLHTVARLTGFKAKWVNLTFNDAHIYVNHLDQVKEQLSREPRPLPRLAVHKDMPMYSTLFQETERMFQAHGEDYDQRAIREVVVGKVTTALRELNPDWFELAGYDPHPAIAAPMAV